MSRNEQNNNSSSIFQSRSTTNVLLFLVVLFLACWVLKFLDVVLIPFLIAVFVVMIIQPIMKFLERWFPRWFSLSLVLLLVGVLLFVISFLFFLGIKEISYKAPLYIHKFHKMTVGILTFLQKYNIVITKEQLGTQKIVALGLNYLSSGISSFFSISGHTLLILFLVIFLELEVHSLTQKLRDSFKSKTVELLQINTNEVKEQLQSYLFAKTVVSLFTGLFTALICFFLGVDFYFFWGILAFLLNYIPNIGSAIGMIPPIFLAFVQFGGDWKSFSTLCLLGMLQTFMGYIVDPRLMGQSLSLSPFVILLSIVFWGWIWGIAGAILAVPLLVCIKVFCHATPGLEPISIFLEGGDASSKKA